MRVLHASKSASYCSASVCELFPKMFFCFCEDCRDEEKQTGNKRKGKQSV